MTLPFRTPQLRFARSARRLLLAAFSAVGLGSCAATAQLPPLQPVSALVTHIMARAVAVDTLISRVQEHLDIVHPLQKEAVSVGGLGPIRLGMTIQEAANAAQVSFVLAPLAQSAVCKYYLPENYDVERGKRTMPIDGIGLMVVNDQVIRIDIWPGSPVKTRSGLGIGSTIEDVKTAYDQQIEVTPRPFMKGNYLMLTPEAAGSNLYSLVFETDKDGKVTQFRTGQFPAVTWSEGCS